MPLVGKTLHPTAVPQRPTFRPISFNASCLFSKVHTAVRHVVDSATNHLAVLFAQTAREHPDREFLIFGSRRMTYAQVEREAMAFAEALAGLGGQAGGRLGGDPPDWAGWGGTLLRSADRSAVVAPLHPSPPAHRPK